MHLHHENTMTENDVMGDNTSITMDILHGHDLILLQSHLSLM